MTAQSEAAAPTIHRRSQFFPAVAVCVILVLPAMAQATARDSFGVSLFDWPWLAVKLPWIVVAGCGAALVLTAVAESGKAGRTAAPWLALILVATAFALSPVAKMATGWSSDVVMAGLLPMSDAQGYFSGALDFLWSGQLSAWVTRRPLVATHLAGLFALTDLDLRLTVWLLAAGCALGTLLVLSLIARTFGWVAAAIATLCLFCFIYPTLGNTMSESLGFTVGCAAFVLLWEGARQMRPGLAVAGVALLSLALAARAGALFILPALAVWMSLHFARSAKVNWRIGGLALIAATVGFVATQLLVKTVGAPEQLAYSNFSSVVYGLVARGVAWNQVFIDNPDLVSLPEGEQAMVIYRLALDHALAAPLDPVVGVLRRYKDFLLLPAGWHQYLPSRYLRSPFMLLTAIGIVHCWRNRAQPIHGLLLAGAAGILLSVPFTGDGGSRVFAASHAFSATLAALGAAVAWQRLRRRTPVTGSFNNEASATVPFAILLALAFLAPTAVALAVASSHPASPRDLPPCAADQIALRGIAARHGAVLICPAGSKSCADGVRADSMAATNTLKAPEVGRLIGFSAPVRIVNVAMPSSAASKLLIANDLPTPIGPFAGCGRLYDPMMIELMSLSQK